MLTFRSEDFLLKNSILRFSSRILRPMNGKYFRKKVKTYENNMTTLTPRGLVSDPRSGPKCEVLM